MTEHTQWVLFTSLDVLSSPSTWAKPQLLHFYPLQRLCDLQVLQIVQIVWPAHVQSLFSKPCTLPVSLSAWRGSSVGSSHWSLRRCAADLWQEEEEEGKVWQNLQVCDRAGQGSGQHWVTQYIVAFLHTVAWAQVSVRRRAESNSYLKNISRQSRQTREWHN